MVAASAPIINALTIDLEDWPQSVLDHRLPITDRVVRNTDRVLEVLDRRQVRATFFALGLVCERFPDLLPRIASAGHEIASHGYGHELVYNLTQEQFRADVARSVEIIESQTGRRPLGYRAPAFSVSANTPWFASTLAELGFAYSSSVFPIAGRRYGNPDAARFVHRWEGCDLVEFPLTTIRRFGRSLPIAGGGYLRLLPGAVMVRAFREVNRGGAPAVLYLHPYEFSPEEFSVLKRQGWRIAPRTYVHQSLFRGRVVGRLNRLMDALPFAPMAEVLGLDSRVGVRRCADRSTLVSSLEPCRAVAHSTT